MIEEWLLRYDDNAELTLIKSENYEIARVVRCRDCKHWKEVPAPYIDSCEYDYFSTNPDGYCYKGVIRQGKEENEQCGADTRRANND